MWLNLAAKLVPGMIKTGMSIAANRRKTKELESVAELKMAERMATGEVEFKKAVIDSHKGDWKDEFVLIVLTLPILVIAYGVFSEDPAASAKIKEFFDQFQQLPSWFTNLWILVVASIYGIKGTQIFKNNKK